MSTTITRKQARQRLAAARASTLSVKERQQLLEEWRSLDTNDEGWTLIPESLREELANSEGTADPSLQRYDPLLQVAMLRETRGVTNRWLAAELARFSSEYEVNGQPEPLLECRCCGYLTLEARGAYEICPVCFWEDDGSDQLAQHSGPNHMTLRQGRQNFERFGACSESAIAHVRRDGRTMFLRTHPSPHSSE